MHDEIGVAHARIEMRELTQPINDRTRNERQVGEAEAVLGPPVGFDLVANDIDVGEVHFDDAEGVWTDCFTHHHVSTGELTDFGQTDRAVTFASCNCWCGGSGSQEAAQPLSRSGRRRCCGGRCCGTGSGALGIDVIEYVIASNATSGTRSSNGVGVEAVLIDESPNNRREEAIVSCFSDGWLCDRGRRSRRSRSRAAAAAGCATGAGADVARLCSRSCRCGSASVSDNGDHSSNVDGVAFLDADLGQRSRHRRGHLGVHFVSRHLKQRLVFGNGVADAFEPLCDRAFGDGLAELRKSDICHGGVLTGVVTCVVLESWAGVVSH